MGYSKKNHILSRPSSDTLTANETYIANGQKLSASATFLAAKILFKAKSGTSSMELDVVFQESMTYLGIEYSEKQILEAANIVLVNFIKKPCRAVITKYR